MQIEVVRSSNVIRLDSRVNGNWILTCLIYYGTTGIIKQKRSAYAILKFNTPNNSRSILPSKDWLFPIWSRVRHNPDWGPLEKRTQCREPHTLLTAKNSCKCYLVTSPLLVAFAHSSIFGRSISMMLRFNIETAGAVLLPVIRPHLKRLYLSPPKLTWIVGNDLRDPRD